MTTRVFYTLPKLILLVLLILIYKNGVEKDGRERVPYLLGFSLVLMLFLMFQILDLLPLNGLLLAVAA